MAMKEVINSAIHESVFFFAHEDLMFAFFHNDIKHVSNLSKCQLLQALTSVFRKFKFLSLNFESNSYLKVIDYAFEKTAGPPLINCF